MDYEIAPSVILASHPVNAEVDKGAEMPSFLATLWREVSTARR